MTSRTCARIASMSNSDTDGKRRTTSTSSRRWLSSSFMLVSQVPARPSSVFGGNTRKKFGRKLSHSTWRKLVTSASSVSPATSKVSRSPSLRPISSW